MWTNHVFSKLATSPIDGDIDEFHTLTEHGPHDNRFTEVISRRSGITQERSVAFIQDCGDRFYVGVDGIVSDILPDCPYAFELRKTRQGLIKGRPITFIHGYFASKKCSIPNLEELLTEQPKHLRMILERANVEGAVRGKPIHVETVEFVSRRSPGTTWDNIAREFEAGEREGQTATFTKDGNLFRWLGSSGAGKTVSEPLKARPDQKKTMPLDGQERINLLPYALMGLGVLVAGWIVWEIVSSLLSHHGADPKSH